MLDNKNVIDLLESFVAEMDEPAVMKDENAAGSDNPGTEVGVNWESNVFSDNITRVEVSLPLDAGGVKSCIVW